MADCQLLLQLNCCRRGKTEKHKRGATSAASEKIKNSKSACAPLSHSLSLSLSVAPLRWNLTTRVGEPDFYE